MQTPPSIEDLLAIRGLIERYADAVNRRDSDAITALWAENGRWSVPEAEGFEHVVGKAAIKSTWELLLGNFPIAFFLCVPGEILIHGMTAATRSYAQEVTKTKAGELSTAVGYYEDEFVCSDGIWLFRQRVWQTMCRYHPQLVNSAPDP